MVSAFIRSGLLTADNTIRGEEMTPLWDLHRYTLHENREIDTQRERKGEEKGERERERKRERETSFLLSFSLSILLLIIPSLCSVTVPCP